MTNEAQPWFAACSLCINKKHNAEVKLLETRMPYLMIEDMVAAQKARWKSFLNSWACLSLYYFITSNKHWCETLKIFLYLVISLFTWSQQCLVVCWKADFPHWLTITPFHLLRVKYWMDWVLILWEATHHLW